MKYLKMDRDNYIVVYQRIKILCVSQNTTIQGVGLHIGKSKSFLSNNKAVPKLTLGMLMSIAIYLDTTIQHLLNGVDYEVVEEQKKKPVKKSKQDDCVGSIGNTLCWRCANACNSGCSWSARFEPVKGWEAIYKPLRPNNKNDSYIVIRCPEFVRG